LLIDEAAGREEARRRRIQSIGTLGILRNAHAMGLLDLREAVTKLRDNGFHMSEALLQTILSSIL
jgi:predicted nucleic acid-binding protein